MSTFSVVCRHFILSFVAVLRPRRVSQFYISVVTLDWKLKCSWFLKLFCNYGAAIHDICMYDVPMSIRLAACCYSFNVKELFKLPTRDFPPITPSTENLNRNFPKQPLLLENLRYFGNWPMTSQEMSSRSYIISKHITVKAFKNVLTCKDLAALARQGNS